MDAGQNGNWGKFDPLNEQIYAIFYTKYDGMGNPQDAFLSFRRDFFMGDKRSLKVKKQTTIKGFPGEIRGKISTHAINWKVTIGSVDTEQTYQTQNGYVLVKRGFNKSLLSRSYFDKNHQWQKSEYFKPGGLDTSRPQIVLSPIEWRVKIELQEYSERTRKTKTKILYPTPYFTSSPYQNVIDTVYGRPTLIVYTTSGTYCYCTEKNVQKRQAAMEEINQSPILMNASWKVDREAIQLENEEQGIPGQTVDFQDMQHVGMVQQQEEDAYVGQASVEKASIDAEADNNFAKPSAEEEEPSKSEPIKAEMPEEQARTELGQEVVATESEIEAVEWETDAEEPSASEPIKAEMPEEQARTESGPEAVAAGSEIEAVEWEAEAEEPSESEPIKAEMPEEQARTELGQEVVATESEIEAVEWEAEAEEPSVSEPIKAESPEEQARTESVSEAVAKKVTESGTSEVDKTKEERNIAHEGLSKDLEILQVPKATEGSIQRAFSGDFKYPVDVAHDSLMEAKETIDSQSIEKEELQMPEITSNLSDMHNKPKSDSWENGHVRIEQDGVTAYEGGYENGKRHGFGSYYYQDGMLCYAGFWKEGQKEGLGVSFRHEDQALHVANWQDNQPVGFVSLFDPEGNFKFGGKMTDGKKDGVGVSYNNSERTVFVGKWSDGEYTGYGSVFDEKGTLLYSGMWKDGKRHGTGTSFDQDGAIVFTGEWRDGHEYNGVYFKHGELDG